MEGYKRFGIGGDVGSSSPGIKVLPVEDPLREVELVRSEDLVLLRVEAALDLLSDLDILSLNALRKLNDAGYYNLE